MPRRRRRATLCALVLLRFATAAAAGPPARTCSASGCGAAPTSAAAASPAGGADGAASPSELAGRARAQKPLALAPGGASGGWAASPSSGCSKSDMAAERSRTAGTHVFPASGTARHRAARPLPFSAHAAAERGSLPHAAARGDGGRNARLFAALTATCGAAAPASSLRARRRAANLLPRRAQQRHAPTHAFAQVPLRHPNSSFRCARSRSAASASASSTRWRCVRRGSSCFATRAACSRAALPRLGVAFETQVQSFFSADEYWQSLEVAHRVAFGCACSAACCSCRALTLGRAAAGLGTAI